jgi:protein phosphatase
MNLFRRLFSQSNNDAAPPTDTAVPPVDSPPPDNEATKTTKPLEGEIHILNLSEGATRELPPDTLIPQTGSTHLIFGQATDVGTVRSNNQDSAFAFFAAPRSVDDMPDFGIFIVADGMGGHHDGEKASAITMRTVATQITKSIYMPLLAGENANQIPITEALVAAVDRANADVASRVPDGGTTLSVCVIIGGLAYIAHVGDSRIYLIMRDSMEQITRDHSLVQRLIELGQLTPEEAVEHNQKHVLYRALGQNESVEVDTLTRRLPPRSRLLICSDGLWGQVSEREILDIIKQYPHPQEACNKLVALANTRGGIDNVTVILLHLPG